MTPLRSAVLVLLLVPTSGGASRAQDLPPALAERFSQGVSALKAGQADHAERAFREVLAAGGARAFVHHNLGIALQQQGRHADALAAFRAASGLDPAFGPARLLAGTSLLALGRTKEAVTELDRAATLLPAERAVYLQLGEAHERIGNVPGLVDAYRQLTALAPNDGEYAYRLAKAYLRLAEWSFERLRDVSPRSGRLQQALGEQYLGQGRPDLALAAFEEAARLEPSLPGVHLAMARIHAEAGRKEDAAREVARELAIVPASRAARELKQALERDR